MTQSNTLFRREVLEFQQHARDWGQVALPQPISTRILTWAITAALTILVVFLYVAQYARKETVEGYLTLSTGRAKVFAPQPGIIKKVHIQEGDQVVEGQPLLTVETAQITLDGQDVNASLLSTLSIQRNLLAQQVRAEEARTLSERARLLAQAKGLETEISNLEVMVRIQNDRIMIFKNFVGSAEQLKSKGYGSDLEFRRRQQELLEQEQNLNSLKQQLVSRATQLTEIRYNIAQLPTIMGQKVQLLRNELSEVDQRIAEVNSRRAYTIRASTAGRVSTLQASVGQAADPRYLQLEIIPNDSILQVELFIPTRAVGFVEIGQDVRLLYQAFPYQKFGTYRGRITRLSKTVVTSSDVRVPVALREPVYRAVAALEQPHIHVDGRIVPLQADMLVTADIILEKQSVLSWIFKPVVAAKHLINTEQLRHLFDEWRDRIVRTHHVLKAWLIKVGVLRREADMPNAANPEYLQHA